VKSEKCFLTNPVKVLPGLTTKKKQKYSRKAGHYPGTHPSSAKTDYGGQAGPGVKQKIIVS
jgi:hypothetical protein